MGAINVLKILIGPGRECGRFRGDDGAVELCCGGVVDEEEVRCFEDEGVVGGNGWESGYGRTSAGCAGEGGRKGEGLLR